MIRMLKIAASLLVFAAGLVLVSIGAYALATIADKKASTLVVGLGVILMILCVLPKLKLYRNIIIKRVYRVVLIAISCFFAFCLFISSFMAFGFNRYKGEEFDGTVIVLGAKINGSRPSLLLQSRLNQAAKILKQNPKSKCVVSGGQGEDEKYAEAQIMRDYLIQKGINGNRIIPESNSDNTQQNIEFSIDLIREKGLSEDVVIVTNYFHQYRGQIFAANAGLAAKSSAGVGRLDLEVLYWFREIPAVVKAWFIIST